MSTEASSVTEQSLAIPKGAEVSLLTVQQWLASPEVQNQITEMQIEVADEQTAALELSCVTETTKGNYSLDVDKYASIDVQLSLTKGKMKRVEAGFALALDPLNKILTFVRQAKNSIIGPLEGIEKHFKGQMLTFTAIQKRQNDEADRIARKEAQDREDAARIATAENLVAAGVDPNQAVKVLDAPSTVSYVPTYRPPAPKGSGSIREKWQFQFDEAPANDPLALKRKLVQLAAKDDRLLAYLDFIIPALNRDCATQKSMMKIEGVGHAVDVGSVSSRAR